MQAPQTIAVLLPIFMDDPLSYALPRNQTIEVGAWVRVKLKNQTIDGIVVELLPPSPTHLKLIESVLPVPPFSNDLLKLIDWIANYTLTPKGLVLKLALYDADELLTETARLGVRITGKLLEKATPARQKLMNFMQDGLMRIKTEAARESGVSLAVVNSLIDEGNLAVEPLPKEKAPNLNSLHAPPQLTQEQQEAVELLNNFKDEFSVTLLEGVTGSGKTEVYAERIAESLKRNEQTLLLMPEIALTPSFTERLAKRFGAEPIQWHSSLTSARRKKNYQFIQNGEAKLVIGARSALLLPFKNLKLIIIDEEHEPSYKQEEGVRYHARDMAIVRGKIENFPVILASATPSIETKVNAREGKYHHLTLESRFGEGRLPTIHLLDLTKHPLPKQQWVSPFIKQKIEETLSKNQQALLFLNRRGYSPLTLCKSCGERFSCPSCSVFLTEHRFKNRLLCHHCGHNQEKPKNCFKCDGDEFASIGPGVERLAEEITLSFPNHKTLILSSDMGGGMAQLKEEIKRIEERKVDIIIGTQLVAKGHHFGGIGFVGVIDADLALGQTDPRASERTYQILSQVTGRAGREQEGAEAILQTFLPQHPVLQAIKNNDKENFYTNEILSRERGSLPPFGRLAALIISSEDEQAAMRFARELAQSHPTNPAVSLLGPVEAPLYKLKERYRIRLLLKTKKAFNLSKHIEDWLKQAPKPKGSTRLDIDIDPLNFM